ncbi:hypothetical protein H072_10157 [Dactylellina haptotyla CBS 200.50]|uniref:Uncharacterized protein n=1 Tax=Dactylellina haptotyla (strain CBS 200.50) TaxID=1284197 RepID=S8BB44_DACHA|nr:hypothetical protein H072_10157 [Dactylellina haptotyla CBS 200.50]
MSVSKAATYLSLLDTARCNADWATVPELVRKLTKHGGAHKKCVTETALLDHDTSPQRLSHTLHKNATIVVSASPLSKASSSQPQTANAVSTLVSISGLAQAFEEDIAIFKSANAAALAEEAALEAEGAPSNKRKKKHSDHIVTSPEEIYQAEVTLAYLHHLLRAHRVVLQILPPHPPPRDQISQEWTKVCAIKALCLKGMAQEALKMKEDAIQTYKGLPIPDFSSGVGSSGAEAIWWIRRTLSRFAIASWELFEGVESPDTPRSAHAEDDEQAHDDDDEEEDHDEDAYDEEAGLDELDATHAGLATVREGSERSGGSRGSGSAGSGTAKPVSVKTTTPAPSSRPVSTIQSRPVSTRPEFKRALTESGLIGAFRAYHAFSMSLTNIRPTTAMTTSATSASFAKQLTDRVAADDDISRKAIYETYLKVVSKFLKTQIERDEEISDEIRAEITAIEEIYESLLLKTTKFPHASKVNHDVLRWVDTVFDNWVTLGSRGVDAGRVVEILYRAAGKSFHSPRILRYLFTTLTSMGNFHDARLSLDTYISLISRGKARLEKEKGGAQSPVSEEDFDSDPQILTTCVQGIRFLVKYFPDQATRAVEIANLIKTWIFEWQTEDQDILALVWRGVGLANAAWSRQTVESTQRTEIQERSISAFKKCLEYQPEMFEAMFDLGLMQAETRDIDSAIDSIRAVAEQEEKCIPAWHLLTLLLTSKGDWDTALTVSEAIFSLIDDQEQASLGLSSRDGLVEIKITQLAIIEMLEGPESAVNLADELLGLYTRLFPGVLPSAMSMRDSVLDSERPTTRGRSTTAGTATTNMPAIHITDTRGGASASDPNLSKRTHHRSGTRGSSLGRNSLRKKRHSVHSITDPVTDDEKGTRPKTPNKLQRSSSQKSTKSTKSAKSVGAKSHKSRHDASVPATERGTMPSIPPTNVAGDVVTAQAIHANASHSATPSVLSEKNNNAHNLPVGQLPSPIKAYTDDRPLLNRPAYLREPLLSERDERKKVEAGLKKIWLTVAGLYRRAEMFEDAKVAVEEASGVSEGGRIEGGIDPDIWAERGFLSIAQKINHDAQKFFETALSYNTDHPLAIVGLSRVLLGDEKNSAARDRASGLLQTLTKLGSGWDMSEAWFELAREHELSGATEKAKEVYWWVVKLEDTRGVRGWGCVIPKVL